MLPWKPVKGSQQRMDAACPTSFACYPLCYLERRIEWEMVHYLPNLRESSLGCLQLRQLLISVDLCP